MTYPLSARPLARRGGLPHEGHQRSAAHGRRLGLRDQVGRHAVLAAVALDGVRAWSTTGRDVAVSFPELAALAPALAPLDALLDGEVVALDDAGRPSFERLQHRMHVTSAVDAARRAAEVPVAYVVFDLLRLGGHDLIDRPWHERRRLLEQIGDDLPAGVDVARVRRRRGPAGGGGGPGSRGCRRKAARRPLRAGRPQPAVGEGQGPPARRVGRGRVERGGGQPRGRPRVAARRRLRQARRRGAALRRPGGVGLHRARAGPHGPPVGAARHPRLPVRPPARAPPPARRALGATRGGGRDRLRRDHLRGRIRHPVYMGERTDVDPSQVVRPDRQS